MISIIICSRKPDISTQLRDNVQSTIGVKHEIIVIDNSENRYSICSAYNEGINLSHGDILCFIHEDILFHTKNWGIQLISHFKKSNVGLIGVAGSKLMPIVPSQWSSEHRYINILQYDAKKMTSNLEKEPRSMHQYLESVVLLDGVFLSANKNIFQKIGFDSDLLKGFHGYDYDISAQSIHAGFMNYITYDILLEHFSEGRKDKQYYNSLIDVYKKWMYNLPFTSEDYKSIYKQNNLLLEKQHLKKLLRRMGKKGFTTAEIMREYDTYFTLFKNKNLNIQIKGLKLYILVNRLFKAPQYIFK